MNDHHDDETITYTIPKKQRGTIGKDFVLRKVALDSREVQYLKHDVDRYRLKQEAEQLFSTINILNVYMVENLKLEEEYAAKKSSLKYAGRTSKELDEHLVFLGRSKREAMETICQQGVVAEPGLHFLGDPNMGVYLWRHPDLCLDSLTSKMSGTTNYLIILRLIRGRIMPVVPRTNTSLEPTPNYDCHVNRLYTRGQQDNNLELSQIYIFDYDEEDALPRLRPRQCLPFAVIQFENSGYHHASTTIEALLSSEKKSSLDVKLPTDVSHVIWSGFMCNKDVIDIGSVRLLSGHRFHLPLHFLMNLTKKTTFNEVMKFLPGDICDAWNITVNFRHLTFDIFLVDPIESRSAKNIEKLAKGLASKIQSFGVVICDVSTRIYLLPSSDLAIHLGFCKNVEPWKLFGILLNNKKSTHLPQNLPASNESLNIEDSFNDKESFNASFNSKCPGYENLSCMSNLLDTDESKMQNVSLEQPQLCNNQFYLTTTSMIDTTAGASEDFISVDDTYLNMIEDEKSIYDPETIFEGAGSSCQMQFEHRQTKDDNETVFSSSQIDLEIIAEEAIKEAPKPMENQRFDIDDKITINVETICYSTADGTLQGSTHHDSSAIRDPRLKRKCTQSEMVELEYNDFKNMVAKLRKMFSKSKRKRRKKRMSDRIRETLMNMVASFSIVHNDSDNLFHNYLAKMVKEVKQLNISLLPTENVLNILEVFLESSNPNSSQYKMDGLSDNIPCDNMCIESKSQPEPTTSCSTMINRKSSPNQPLTRIATCNTSTPELHAESCLKVNIVVNNQFSCAMPEAGFPKSEAIALQKDTLNHALDDTFYSDGSTTADTNSTISPCKTQLATMKPKGRSRPKARARARAKARRRFYNSRQFKDVRLLPNSTPHFTFPASSSPPPPPPPPLPPPLPLTTPSFPSPPAPPAPPIPFLPLALPFRRRSFAPPRSPAPPSPPPPPPLPPYPPPAPPPAPPYRPTAFSIPSTRPHLASSSFTSSPPIFPFSPSYPTHHF